MENKLTEETRKMGIKVLFDTIDKIKDTLTYSGETVELSLVLEGLIFSLSKIKNEENENDFDVSLYKMILYQVVGDFQAGEDISEIKQSLNLGKYGWNHKIYEAVRYKVEEQDSFIENPFEVEEGVLTCNKCGGKRVFSYSKQHRGGDEPMTTYATCVNPTCKAQWAFNG
jgi:DNA-directed RNA polymerase subunit M/transcription elongation factor TFIIS